MALISLNNLERFFNNLKTYISNALNSKANSSHTHTSSDVTDLSTILDGKLDVTDVFATWNYSNGNLEIPNVFSNTIDSSLSSSSENPVQNKVIKSALDGLTSAGLLPIGSYIQFAGSQAPEGFLVCNGGAISRTTYSELFAVIGTTYGSGDGSTTFNLPNLTDRFLQGSSTSGTVKNAGLPDITAWADGKLGVGLANGAFAIGNLAAGNSDGGAAAYHGLSFDASWSNSIYGNSDTVQPPALTCLICIKY